METVFLKLLNMSITAGWLILLVVVLRVLLKRAPKYIRCILWGFVGLRLVCPFSFESILSLIPSSETVSPEMLYSNSPTIHSGINALNAAVNPIISQSLAPTAGASVNPMQLITHAASIVWIIGMAAMLLYCIVSYMRLYRRMRTAVLLRDNIWQSEDATSPFVLGFVRPRIYLPFEMDADTMSHVIAHENAHLKRRDHWTKPLAFLLLTVYWFNPLIWLAYVLLCRDIELACDEKVINGLGIEGKKAYSSALLSCASPQRMITACPLAFGEVSVKSRIKNVLSYKQPAFWIILLALICCLVIALCFLTNPKDEVESAPPDISGQIYRVESTVYLYPYYSYSFLLSDTAEYMMSEAAELLTRDMGDWSSLGALAEVSLTKDNFDSIFTSYEDVNGGFSARKLREDNSKAWQLSQPDEASLELHYMLLQNNGDVYLAYGYPEIRSAFKMTPVSDIEDLLIKSPGESQNAIAQADVDGDGIAEFITIDEQPDAMQFTLRVLEADGGELWSKTLATPHVGWDSLFLCTLDGTDYLLSYNPSIFQGMCSYSYELFTLEGGTPSIVQTRTVQFASSYEEKLLDADELGSFADEVNALLSDSVLLISTKDGEAEIGPASSGPYLEVYDVFSLSGASNLSEAVAIRAAQVYLSQKGQDKAENFYFPDITEADTKRLDAMIPLATDYDAYNAIYELTFSTSSDSDGDIVLFVDSHGTVFGTVE